MKECKFLANAVRLIGTCLAAKNTPLGINGILVDPGQFEAAGVRPEARPEELALSDWIALTRAVWP